MSVSGKSMRTPLARARGLGSAKDGVHHWWMQRLTAIVLAVLTPWFLWQSFVARFGATWICSGPEMPQMCVDHAFQDLFAAWLGQPAHAVPMLAFVLALFWHAKLGLQVVIEDYVHTRWLEVTLQVLNTFACSLGALVSVFAIGRIVFTH